MPAVIDSAPDATADSETADSDCILRETGTETARVDDSADFILQANYEDCAGFMTFGPGTVYGETGAETTYYILTYLGIAFVAVALIAWVLFEHRHLISYASDRIPRRR
jgi:hypothetical protein